MLLRSSAQSRTRNHHLGPLDAKVLNLVVCELANRQRHLRFNSRPRLGKQTPEDQVDVESHFQSSLPLTQGLLKHWQVRLLDLPDFGLKVLQQVSLLAEACDVPRIKQSSLRRSLRLCSDLVKGVLPHDQVHSSVRALGECLL